METWKDKSKMAFQADRMSGGLGGFSWSERFSGRFEEQDNEVEK